MVTLLASTSLPLARYSFSSGLTVAEWKIVPVARPSGKDTAFILKVKVKVSPGAINGTTQFSAAGLASSAVDPNAGSAQTMPAVPRVEPLSSFLPLIVKPPW